MEEHVRAARLRCLARQDLGFSGDEDKGKVRTFQDMRANQDKAKFYKQRMNKILYNMFDNCITAKHNIDSGTTGKYKCHKLAKRK